MEDWFQVSHAKVVPRAKFSGSTRKLQRFYSQDPKRGSEELDHLRHPQSLHNRFVMKWPLALAKRPEGRMASYASAGHENSHRAGGYSPMEVGC
jgi:hypothetical protein